MYIWIEIYTHTAWDAYTWHIYMLKHMYIHIWTYTHLCIYIHTCTHIYIYTYTHTYAHTHRYRRDQVEGVSSGFLCGKDSVQSLYKGAGGGKMSLTLFARTDRGYLYWDLEIKVLMKTLDYLTDQDVEVLSSLARSPCLQPALLHKHTRTWHTCLFL